MKFETFSKKQLKTLSWWCPSSIYKDYDAIICDGAVRSGKTLCMGISFIIWSFFKFENSVFAICGKTIRSLKRNFINTVLPVLNELGFGYKMVSSENLLQISYKNCTNKFYLFGGKDESSSSLIQGITLSGILLDEVALMPRSFVEQALARCSVSGSKFWFNCNPEYPQHWFYQEWIVNAKNKNALYLHFTMEDNPSLLPEIKKRYESLYSGTFYQRFVQGKWVATQGAIYPFMCENSAFCTVPDKNFTKYVVSCDYGTVNPSSFGLWGKTDDCWYRIKEYYYDSRKEGVSKTDEEHYESLCNLIKGLPIDSIVVDPSAASFITLIKRKGSFKVLPAKNNVVDGIRLVSSALKDNKIKICNTCKDSMREFSLYRWEDSHSKDVPIKENDHAMDDIRYFVTTVLDEEDDGFFVFAASR